MDNKFIKRSSTFLIISKMRKENMSNWRKWKSGSVYQNFKCVFILTQQFLFKEFVL